MSNQFKETEIQAFDRYVYASNDEKLRSLVGKTFSAVVKTNDGDSDVLRFECSQGAVEFYYQEDCCANCYIESVDGDLADLVGTPLLMAELVTSDENPLHKNEESFTWSFYKFATVRGYVTVRWYGSSNGYYSETVSVRWAEKGTWAP